MLEKVKFEKGEIFWRKIFFARVCLLAVTTHTLPPTPKRMQAKDSAALAISSSSNDELEVDPTNGTEDQSENDLCASEDLAQAILLANPEYQPLFIYAPFTMYPCL